VVLWGGGGGGRGGGGDLFFFFTAESETEKEKPAEASAADSFLAPVHREKNGPRRERGGVGRRKGGVRESADHGISQYHSAKKEGQSGKEGVELGHIYTYLRRGGRKEKKVGQHS